MSSATSEQWATTERTAEHLDKPASWSYNNAARLGVPRYKVGNQWRYKLSEIDAWVESAAQHGGRR